MCGRFTLRAPASIIAEQFALFEMPPFGPRFNVAPSQPIPVVRLAPQREAQPRRELVALGWGLVPGWAKDPAIGNRLINARAETVGQKPAFRAAFAGRRCLVVADGFYEWQKAGREHAPYFFRLRDDRVFAFAGLWEHWQGRDHGELETCTILTTEPSTCVRPVHDRMPVILRPDDYEPWLDPATETEPLTSLLRPYPAEEMEAVAVGPYVNNPAHEGPRCIEPAQRLF